MRHITLVLFLLVGCTDDLPLSDVDGEIDADGVATHNPDNCPGGGGGEVEPSGGGDEPPKRPIPKPRDCTKETDREACYQCCDWNSKHVWEERCKRIKDDKKRGECWRDLENRLRPECQRACPRTALTGGLP
jgi:hypothetical protein